MRWIKRNMFLAVGGLVTLLLLGGGGFLLYGALAKNEAVAAEAESVLKDKERLQTMAPFPAASNITAAKAQIELMGTAKAKVGQFFQPIPFQSVTNVAFKKLLDETVADLQRQAARANTRLPKKSYAFSFEAEKEALTLPATSFPTLPMQLSEVAFLSKVLFDAKVNGLEGIRRPRLSLNSTTTGPEDYHSLQPQTNTVTGTVSTPYEVSIYAFSANLAQILDAFAKTEHGIMVKAVVSEATAPVGATAEATAIGGGDPRGRFRPPQAPPPGRRGDPSKDGMAPPTTPPPTQPPPAGTQRPSAAAAAAKPATVLDENLLRIQLLIYVIRPTTTST